MLHVFTRNREAFEHAMNALAAAITGSADNRGTERGILRRLGAPLRRLQISGRRKVSSSDNNRGARGPGEPYPSKPGLLLLRRPRRGILVTVSKVQEALAIFRGNLLTRISYSTGVQGPGHLLYGLQYLVAPNNLNHPVVVRIEGLSSPRCSTCFLTVKWAALTPLPNRCRGNPAPGPRR